MASKICIELHTDNNNIIPTIVTITSLLKNKNSDTVYDIRLLGNDLSSDNIDLLEKTGIKVLPHKSCLSKYEGLHKYVTSTDLFKFDLPDVLSDIDKVIYIDTDVIVQDDLSELYNVDLGDNYVGAVNDIYISGVINKSKTFDSKQYFGRYFNAGVMLLNLKKMREDNITEKLIDYKLHKDTGRFMSQDALNSVLKDKVLWLSPKFNYMALQIKDCAETKICEAYNITKDECKKLKEDAVIIHFAGSKKPWQYSNLSGHELWKKYYELSILKDKKIEYKKIPFHKLCLHYISSNIKKWFGLFGITVNFPKWRAK